MAELSPAAQAVLTAAEARWLDVDDDIPAQVAIAALLAVADQVAPVDGSRRTQEIRADILAIAAELENQ